MLTEQLALVQVALVPLYVKEAVKVAFHSSAPLASRLLYTFVPVFVPLA